MSACAASAEEAPSNPWAGILADSALSSENALLKNCNALDGVLDCRGHRHRRNGSAESEDISAIWTRYNGMDGERQRPVLHVAADPRLCPAEFAAMAESVAEMALALPPGARLRVWSGADIAYDGPCPRLPAYMLALVERARPPLSTASDLAINLERFIAAARAVEGPSAIALLGDHSMDDLGDAALDRAIRAAWLIRRVLPARAVAMVGGFDFDMRTANCVLDGLGEKLRVYRLPRADLSGIARELA